MDTITEQENPIKSGLYSPKQLFITAAIGGPAIAGFIIASNLWARDKKLLALIPIIPGHGFRFCYSASYRFNCSLLGFKLSSRYAVTCVKAYCSIFLILSFPY